MTHIALIIFCASVVAATTQPADDPARQRARELRQTLGDATIEAILFELRAPQANRTLRLEDPAETAPLVERFAAALSADDLREGKQEHQPARVVRIRIAMTDAPDVLLNSVGMDMFWTAEGESDDSPSDPSLDWINLQSPALTEAFREQFEQLAPTTQPVGAGDARRRAGVGARGAVRWRWRGRS